MLKNGDNVKGEDKKKNRVESHGNKLSHTRTRVFDQGAELIRTR